jgi:hypothetical protein
LGTKAGAKLCGSKPLFVWNFRFGSPISTRRIGQTVSPGKV